MILLFVSMMPTRLDTSADDAVFSLLRSKVALWTAGILATGLMDNRQVARELHVSPWNYDVRSVMQRETNLKLSRTLR